jgi:BASS family bile acid:Na+ symporter
MAFQLDTALLAGVILVGTCPGGTSSNVITYLAGGDVALSVGMTSVNTLLAPILTPAITYLFLHTSVEVDVWSMFLSVVQVVIIPIVLGLLVNRFLGRLTASFAKILPLVSVTAICLIVMAVVSHNAEKILTTGAIVFAVVILHNLLGYACGFGLGKLLRLDVPQATDLVYHLRKDHGLNLPADILNEDECAQALARLLDDAGIGRNEAW